MTWWQTTLVALGSAVVGGALSWSGSYGLFRAQRKARYREEAARLIGEAMAALLELDPEVFLERMQMDERGSEVMALKAERWIAAAGGLDVLRAMQPSAGGAVATSLAAAILQGRAVVLRMIEAVGQASYPRPEWWTAVSMAHDAATEQLTAALAHLR